MLTLSLPPTVLKPQRHNGETVTVAIGSFSFRVTHRQTPFHVDVDCDATGAHVHIAGELAPLPFTAEAPAQREALLNQLGALRNDTAAQFAVSPSGVITTSGDRHISAPVTPVTLLAAVSDFIASALPGLTSLASCLAPGH